LNRPVKKIAVDSYVCEEKVLGKRGRGVGFIGLKCEV
jgi:hypothetical protein